jgi:molecular chaperone DnaK
LVYDLGGGTFDVTAVRLEDKRFRTLATDGEVELGGREWDDRIIDFFGEQFAVQHGFDPARDPASGPRWRESVANQAESIKKLLSQLTSAPIECFCRDRMLRSALTRTEFERRSRDLLMRTQVVTGFVVREQAGLTWNELDRVLLVGGSTRMPMVRDMLKKVTGQEPDDSLDADQVVSHGAALFATIRALQRSEDQLVLHENVEQELRGVAVQDVNSHSLGIETYDKRTGKAVNTILIPHNTPLPVAARKLFRLTKPGAQSVRVKVLEGEAPEASANILLGECRITNLPSNLPAQSPIQVRLSYGSNGRVNVMALEMTSGALVQANIQRHSGLTAEDIRREADFVQSLRIQ